MGRRYIIDGDTLVVRGVGSVTDETLILPDGGVDVDALSLDNSGVEYLLDEEDIPSYNRTKQRFKDFLRMIVDPLEDCNLALFEFLDAFDIESAIGRQLDIVGSIVGVSRVLPFVPTNNSRTLSDDDYRVLIRSKIAANVWDGTNETTQEIFSTIFPEWGLVLEDNQDCSVCIVISTISNVSNLMIEMLGYGILFPVPAGVELTYRIPETVVRSDTIIQAGVYGTGRSAVKAAT